MTRRAPGASALRVSSGVLPFPEPITLEPPRLFLPVVVSWTIAVVFGLAYVLGIGEQEKAILPAGLMVAAVGAYFALARPRFFPFLLAAFTPFSQRYPFAFDISGVNMMNVLMALGLVACVGARAKRRTVLPWTAFDGLLLLFLFLGMLGMFKAMSVLGDRPLSEHLLDYKRWATPILLYFLARGLLEDRREVAGLLWSVMGSAMVVALLTWWDAVTLGDRGSIESSRIGAVLTNPNSLAAFFVYYSIPFLAMAMVLRRWFVRGAYVVGYLVMARVLLFTFSRGGYLALAAGSLVVVMLTNPLYLVGAGAVGLAVPGLLPASVRDRLQQTTTSDEIYDENVAASLDTSSATRLVLWEGGVEMVRRNPIMGVGLGCFGTTIGDYTPVPLKPGDPSDAHNAYLLMAAEIGLPALAVLLLVWAWLGFSSFLAYWRSRDRFDRAVYLGFLGSLCGVAISCMFGSRFSDEALVGGFWLLTAGMMTLRQLPVAASEGGA